MLTAKLASNDADLPREVPFEDDWLTYLHTDAKSLEWELGLYATKWFDYRMMTGVEATKAYIEAYGQVYRDIYARELDRDRAEHIKPLDIDKIMGGLLEDVSKAKKLWKGLWRGRQIADALGMPYGVYIEMAFTFRMRHWNQRHMPQPWHLFHEYDVEKIQAKWEELQQTTLYTSDHPAYMVQNYAGISHQNDYHEWLFAQAMHRSNPAYFLHRFIDNDQLMFEKVESRMPPEITEQVAALLQ